MGRDMTKSLLKPWRVIARDEHEGACIVTFVVSKKLKTGDIITNEIIELPVEVDKNEDEDAVIFSKIVEMGLDE